MSDFISGCGLSLSDAERAELVIEKFSDEDGFTLAEGESLGFIDTQRTALSNVLAKRETESEGMVSQMERSTLTMAGFSQTFVQALAGTDGKKPLENRVRFFTNRLFDSGSLATYWHGADYRTKSLSAISALGDDGKDMAVQTALDLLEGGNATKDTKYWAFQVFEQVLSSTSFFRATENIPSFEEIAHVAIDALKDPDAQVKTAALEVLSSVERRRETVLSSDTTTAILDLIPSANEHCLFLILPLLNKSGPSQSITDAVLPLIGHPNPELKYWVFVVLARQSPSQTITDATLKALKNPNTTTSVIVAALQVFKSASSSQEIAQTAFSLIQTFNNRDINWAAYEVLEEKWGSRTAAALSVLACKDRTVVLAALQELEKERTPPSEAIAQAVFPLLQDSDPSVKALALRVFERKSPFAAVEARAEAILQDSAYDAKTKYVVLRVLVHAPVSSQIINLALIGVNDSDARVRKISVEILKKIKSPTPEITAAIQKYEEEITKEKPE